jgi:pimeloyl-ACP methyl ester carboxylesterase
MGIIRQRFGRIAIAVRRRRQAAFDGHDDCVCRGQRAGRVMWRSLLSLLLGAMLVSGFTGTIRGAGRYVTVEYPPSAAAGELSIGVAYTVWIPDGAPRLRGVIVHQHGAGIGAAEAGAVAAYDLHWQALAKKWDCALLGPSYHVLNNATEVAPGGAVMWFDPRRGSDKAFLKALADLASQSGHPELRTVPWVLWGHSGGAVWCDSMTILHPDRVAAVYLRSGSAFLYRKRWGLGFPELEVPDAVYRIPYMDNPAIKEESRNVWEAGLATFREYRANGALIGFAPDPRSRHECGDSRYLAMVFLDEALALRLPAKGGASQTLKPLDTSKAWLAPPMGDLAVPAASYQGDQKEAVWLLNERVARAWTDYVRTSTVGGDTTPPPAPFRVRVWEKAGAGNEITWDAEADLESGIRGFVVLRDGKELARVPQKPAGQFGRPLFQEMSYHDTPMPPLSDLPAMRYVDTSAKAGEAHTYTVVTVNTMGMKSDPSAQAESR